MCVEFTGDWEVTNEDIIAYKVVNSMDRGSAYHPFNRAPQDGTHLGRTKYYPVGATRRCSNYGIYCYAHLRGAERHVIRGWETYKVIQVIIPKGSRVRYGINNFGKTINASKVIVKS